MSRHKRYARPLGAWFDTLRRSAAGMAVGSAVLLTLAVAGLMNVPAATATYAVVFSVGGLLMIGLAGVTRGSPGPRKLQVEYRRPRVRPLRHR